MTTTAPTMSTAPAISSVTDNARVMQGRVA